MSRNARSNINDRFDEISSNQVNVHGFDGFENSSKRNQLGEIDDFGEF